MTATLRVEMTGRGVPGDPLVLGPADPSVPHATVNRLDPRPARWSAIDLARRRAATVARAEAEASEQRGDPEYVVRLFGQLAVELERLVERRDDGGS